MKTIKDYEVIDHGFDAEQYFQGCGTAFTEFDDVATGIGETAAEALDDALENLAQGDWDVSSIPSRGHGFSRMTVLGYLRRVGGLTREEIENTETHAYVSVRVR